MSFLEHHIKPSKRPEFEKEQAHVDNSVSDMEILAYLFPSVSL